MPKRVEELAIAAIDAGADDFEADESTIEIHSPVEALETIRRSMAECNAVIVSSQLAMLPKNLVTLDEKHGQEDTPASRSAGGVGRRSAGVFQR